jgi:hypothetical protein
VAPKVSRRRFLRRTLLGGALLALGATVLRHLSGYSLDAETRGRLLALSPKQFLVLRAILRRILAADERGAPDPEIVGVALSVDRYLALLPDELASDVRALIELVEHSPALFDARLSRFTHLDEAGQDAVLRGWESSRIELRRRGFQALKSLAMMGYYGDPRAYALLDYRGPLLHPDRP